MIAPVGAEREEVSPRRRGASRRRSLPRRASAASSRAAFRTKPRAFDVAHGQIDMFDASLSHHAKLLQQSPVFAGSRIKRRGGGGSAGLPLVQPQDSLRSNE